MQDHNPPRILMVVQRYGEDIIGGAESLARTLAERFVQGLKWDVEVLTTTARDYGTWRNEMREQCEVVNGVRVRRFHSLFPRFPAFNFIDAALRACMRLAQKLPAGGRLVLCLERAWFWAQGPACPKLLRYLDHEAAAFDAVIFVTYLYFPTVFGLPRIAHKALLVPTAHDEPAFHFRHVGELLDKARFILVNGKAEQSLVLSRTGHRNNGRVRVAGVGIDMPDLLPARQPMPPYLLYLGRIGRAKGVDRLLDWFLGASVDARLILAGKLDDGFALPDDPRVEFLGFVDEARKASLIRNAVAVINPSRFESLSLIVLEALALEVPVLVNGECETLANYAQETETVFPFCSRDDFVGQLVRVCSHNWTTPDSLACLSRSREWVQRHYSWTSILHVYEQSVAELRMSGGRDGDAHSANAPAAQAQISP